MAKSELGTKRVDPETGQKFYDLGREPIVSPYTGKSYPLSFFESVKSSRSRPVAAPVAPRKEDEDEEETVEVAETDEETVSINDVEEDEGQGAKDAMPDVDGDEDDDAADDDADEDDTFLPDDEDENDDMTDILGGGRDDEDDA